MVIKFHDFAMTGKRDVSFPGVVRALHIVLQLKEHLTFDYLQNKKKYKLLTINKFLFITDITISALT